MTNQHPITPPPGLVASLRNLAPHGIRDAGVTRELWLIEHAYSAGADRELEACCEWVSQWCGRWSDGSRPEDGLRTARRPKPPSLKEQALRILVENGTTLDGRIELEPEDIPIIRRALEALPE